MRDDVPAAHSMDTTWYAVDADGVVARFDSGEAGAVPFKAATSSSPSDATFDAFPIEALRMGRTANEAMFEAQETFVPSYPDEVIVVLGQVETDDAPGGYRVSPNVLPAVLGALAKFEAYVLREEEPVLVATRLKVPPDDIAAISKRPGVKLVLTASDMGELIDHVPVEGDPLVVFKNSDYAVPGEYARRQCPDDALRLGDLPAHLREIVAAMKFENVRFRDAAQLQLADHMKDDEAGIWGDNDLRGTRHVATPAGSPASPDTYNIRVIVLSLGMLAFLFFAYWILTR